MDYSIKEVAKNVDITEQGLYKRIRTNYDVYIKKGYIATKLVEQPNGNKEQIFITREGIKDLLKTKHLKETCNNSDFIALNQDAKQVEQPLNQPIKPSLENTTDSETPTSTATQNTELLNLLNRNIEDLKAENKRLIEKLEKQEERFDAKLKEQKEEFNLAFDKQNEAYQKALNTISMNFNNLMQRLPPPQEEEINNEPKDVVIKDDAEITEKPRGIKGFFKRMFN